MLKKIGYVVLYTRAMPKMLKFYRDILGIPVKFRDGSRWVELDTRGATLALRTSVKKDGSVTRMTSSVIFSVQDIDMVYEELKRKGVKFVDPPTLQDFGSKIATFTDPDGHVLKLIGN